MDLVQARRRSARALTKVEKLQADLEQKVNFLCKLFLEHVLALFHAIGCIVFQISLLYIMAGKNRVNKPEIGIKNQYLCHCFEYILVLILAETLCTW